MSDNQGSQKEKQPQKADSIPAAVETSTTPEVPVSEEWQAQLKDVKNSIEATLSGHADDLEKLKVQLQEVGDTILTNNQQTLGQMQKTIDGSLDAYMTMKKNLDARDEEVRRLKSGYDTKIFRNFLRNFIQIDETVRELMETAGNLDEDTRKHVRLIYDMSEYALECCGVTKVSPKIGENYRTAFGVADKPEIVLTDDAGKDWQVAETLSKGYALQGHPDGNREIVIKAKVKIFRHQKGG